MEPSGSTPQITPYAYVADLLRNSDNSKWAVQATSDTVLLSVPIQNGTLQLNLFRGYRSKSTFPPGSEYVAEGRATIPDRTYHFYRPETEALFKVLQDIQSKNYPSLDARLQHAAQDVRLDPAGIAAGLVWKRHVQHNIASYNATAGGVSYNLTKVLVGSQQGAKVHKALLRMSGLAGAQLYQLEINDASAETLYSELELILGSD